MIQSVPSSNIDHPVHTAERLQPDKIIPFWIWTFSRVNIDPPLHFIKESHLENPRPGLLFFSPSLGWVPPPNIIKCFFLVRPSDPASPFWWHPTKSNAKGEQWGSN
jgi:hypothetical protein